MKLTQDTIIRNIRKKTSRPMKVSELARALAINEVQRREFRNHIKKMAAAGTLVRLRGGRYGLPDEMNLITGILHGHPNGYGFLVPDNGEQEGDIYISPKNTSGAMHKDKVVARIESQGGSGRPEGRIIRILERSTTSLVGLFEPLDQDGWIIPMDDKYFHDIFVSGKNKLGAKNGQVVVVEIISYPEKHQPPIGKVVEVLGYSNDPQVELNSIFRKFGIRTDFPLKVLEQAKKATARLNENDKKNRRDLTDWTIFTIDGETAKDFDDAVSLQVTDEGFRLGVHIADVSHYIRKNSALDKEALERGTSIYFPNGVIPMLPFELSNDICSLKPNVKRLTLTALLDFDRKGNMVKSEFFDSVIKSCTRLTYTEVAQLLEKGDTEKKHSEVIDVLKNMHRLSRILRKQRFKNGSVDFQVPELEVHINTEGEVEKIIKAPHNEAHELIEEFMLSANQAVARYLFEQKTPSIHRIHESPDARKIVEFQDFVAGFGLHLRSPGDIQSTDLQNLLKKVRGKPEERVVNTLLLRTMKRAQYSQKDPGHYCLGFEHYTHFTSPIRRYPDLVTHRLLKASLTQKFSGHEKKRLAEEMTEIAEHSTLREGRATEVEREINDLRRAQFMTDKIGKSFTGTIVGVTPFGFFVELIEVFVEGLVHVSSLTDDYYIHIEPEHKWRGQRRHKVYKIGDRVRVKVAKVDLVLRRIDLSLV
ncbi:MAG TPA: ribonuclease R [Nitrospina sp.]|nr:ribonuclease R [Nitrospina sp.]